jgi:hypothetical protein
VDLEVDDVLGFALSYKSTTLLVNKQKETVILLYDVSGTVRSDSAVESDVLAESDSKIIEVDIDEQAKSKTKDLRQICTRNSYVHIHCALYSTDIPVL